MLFAVVRIGCLCIYTAYSCWDHLADVKAAGHCTHLFRHFLIGTVPFIFGEGCPCIDATVFFSRLFQVRSTDFWFVYLPLSCGLEVNQFRMQRNAESLAASKMRWRVNGQWGKPKNWWPKCEWTSSRAEAFIFFFKLYVIFFLKCYVDRDGPKGHSLGFDIRNALSRAPSVFFPFHLFLFFCYQNQLAPRDRNAHSTTFRLEKKRFWTLIPLGFPSWNVETVPYTSALITIWKERCGLWFNYGESMQKGSNLRWNFASSISSGSFVPCHLHLYQDVIRARREKESQPVRCSGPYNICITLRISYT